MLPEGGRPRGESELIHTGAAASPSRSGWPQAERSKTHGTGPGPLPAGWTGTGPAPWFWGCFQPQAAV